MLFRSETGEPVGAQLHSYALTNKPFVPGLHPHRLDREMPGRRLVAASVKASHIVLAKPEESMEENSNPTADAEVAASAVTKLSEQLQEAQVKIVELSAELEAFRAEEERRKEEAAAAQLAADVAEVCEQQNIRLGDEAKQHVQVRGWIRDGRDMPAPQIGRRQRERLHGRSFEEMRFSGHFR